jgi:hypothetical protein
MDLSEQHKLSAPEPAKYLGISTSTLSTLRVFAGGPAFLKFGRRVGGSAQTHLDLRPGQASGELECLAAMLTRGKAG